MKNTSTRSPRRADPKIPTRSGREILAAELAALALSQQKRRECETLERLMWEQEQLPPEERHPALAGRSPRWEREQAALRAAGYEQAIRAARKRLASLHRKVNRPRPRPPLRRFDAPVRRAARARRSPRRATATSPPADEPPAPPALPLTGGAL